MPIFFQAPNSRSSAFDPEEVRRLKTLYAERYTDELDWSPDSELHRLVVSEVFARAQQSRTYMETRFDSWRSIDKTVRAYRDLSEDDEEVLKKDETKPVSLVVPISFMIQQTLLANYSSTFFKPPIFRYRGVEGKDPLTAAKQELIVDLQRYRSKVELSLYGFWRNFIGYGVAFASPIWTRRYGVGTPRAPIGEGRRMLWEGNSLTNISPYDALPDPNRSVNEVVDGEFFGRVRHTNIVELLSEERVNTSMFNCMHLKSMPRLSVFTSFSESSEDRPGEIGGLTPVDVIEKSVTLIPKDWKLGDGEYPEKWLFWIAGDALIIRAEPLGLFYDEHPIVSGAPLFDDYTMTPVSILERIGPMQTFADWLINAYLIGTRRAMAINLVVDPFAINMQDLRSDEIVKLIRLNKSHWGRGKVSDYLHQLKIENVTSENIPGVSFLMDIIQRVTGVSDQLQGIMRTGGERRSALEAQQTFSSAMSRVQADAKIVSIQAHQDIARMFAYNNQQYLSREHRIKITGDLHQRLLTEYGLDEGDVPAVGSTMVISPNDFLEDFDNNIISYDASVPGDEDRNAWIQLVSPMFAQPQTGTLLGLDMKRIFLHVARQLGATNVADFLARPTKARTMAPENIEREVDRGNLAPIEPPVDHFGLS